MSRDQPVDTQHLPAWPIRVLFWAGRAAFLMLVLVIAVFAAYRLLLADTLPESNRMAADRIDLGCVSNAVGCYMMKLSPPLRFAVYDQLVLDYTAHLRLAAALRWLRTDPEVGSWPGRFARCPKALRSNGHVSGIDAERGQLYVDNPHTERAARFSLPLPRAGMEWKQ